MNHGEMIFLGFAALIVFWQFVKGWRLGFVRQLARFGALGGAYLAAYWGASSLVPFIRPLGYPDFVLLVLAGSAIWVGVYLFIAGLGAMLFKRTAHQDLGLVWFFYGTSGAVMGAAFGLLLVLGVADVVRVLGAVSEGAATNIKKQGLAAVEITEMKHGIETGNSGDILKTIDPLPKRVYTMAEKIGRVASNVEMMERFLSFPGSRDLAQRPDIQALQCDPDVIAAIRGGRYRDLLKNPKVVRAMNAPQTAALFREFQWEKALDYALEK